MNDVSLMIALIHVYSIDFQTRFSRKHEASCEKILTYIFFTYFHVQNNFLSIFSFFLVTFVINIQVYIYIYIYIQFVFLENEDSNEKNLSFLFDSFFHVALTRLNVDSLRHPVLLKVNAGILLRVCPCIYHTTISSRSIRN